MVSVLDFPIDERCTLTVKVNTKTPDGEPRDVTGASIEWEATHLGITTLTKTTGVATIIIAGDGESFSFTCLPADTNLPAGVKYGVPVVWQHEARVTLATEQYLAVKGRMFVWPSQTGE